MNETTKAYVFQESPRNINFVVLTYGEKYLCMYNLTQPQNRSNITMGCAQEEKLQKEGKPSNNFIEPYGTSFCLFGQ